MTHRQHRQHSPETFEERLARLEELRQAAVHSNVEAEEKQHARGKYTARGASTGTSRCSRA